MRQSKTQTITYEKCPPEPAPEHEYAKLFPLLDGEAREELVSDIKQNGVQEPIVFLDGAILDGRNRYYAARECGVSYPRVDFDGDDPLAFVVSKNLHRRQLTTSQRAMIAAKLANLAVGSNQHVLRVTHDNATGEEFSPPLQVAAKSVGVDRKTAQFGRTVVRKGIPQLAEAVEAGQVSVSAAAEVATLPASQQEDIVAHGDDAILEEASRIRERKRQERLAKQRENDAARDKTRASLPDGIKRGERAKAQNGSAHAAVASEIESIRAERDELLEENAALKADIVERDRRLALFDEIAVRWEKGGFDAIKATLDDRIKALKRQVEDLSADKATAVRQRDFWKKQAMALGYVSPNVAAETSTAFNEAEPF